MAISLGLEVSREPSAAKISLIFVMLISLSFVARSRQVCIYVVEALLVAIYLGNDLILIDIRKPSAERLSRPI